jgi:ankyrin repeat protein
MFASRQGHIDVVKLLLARSASPSVQTETGATALKWALQTQNTDIAQLLRKAGATE